MNDEFSKEKYLAIMLEASPDSLLYHLARDLSNRVSPLVAAASLIQDHPLNPQDNKACMDLILARATEIQHIAEAIRAYDKLQRRKKTSEA